ncbi:MAG: AAA family ATPase [Lachnospiraceae bacterium]
MNIKEAKDEICRTIKAYTAKDNAGLYRIPARSRRPIFLMGTPGIGKTAIISQAARECRIGFLSYTMTHHTRQSAIGLPLIREHSFRGKTYSMTEYTMSEIIGGVYDRIEQTGQEEGILFLDEINCVSETLLPTMLQFLQFKMFGTHVLPDGWIIAAAGNPPKYNRSAREFDVVTLDRVKYMELEADLDTWLSYAAGRSVHDSILSYLRLNREDFTTFSRSEYGREFVTPRSWEDLSQALKTYEALELPVEDSFFSQYLQSRTVSESFASYYRLCRKLSEDAPFAELLESGTMPPASLSLASRPADERFCLITQLSGMLRRESQDYMEEETLLQSLSYFADGLEHSLNAVQPAASQTDFDLIRPTSEASSASAFFPAFSTACQSLLKKRTLAMNTKQSLGLLAPEEERLEHLLSAQVTTFLQNLRLNTAASPARRLPQYAPHQTK